MRGTCLFLAGAAIALVGTAASAQHWTPPTPGHDICSGWDTPEAQRACRDKATADRKRADDERSAQAAHTQAVIKAAEDARIRAEADRAEAIRKARADMQARQLAAAEAYAREEAADPYKRVDPADLAIETDRFVGRKLKMGGMQCYVVEHGDYRCWTRDRFVTVRAASVTPDDIREGVDKRCTAMREVLAGHCTTTLRFELADYKANADDTLTLWADVLNLN